VFETELQKATNFAPDLSLEELVKESIIFAALSKLLMY